MNICDMQICMKICGVQNCEKFFGNVEFFGNIRISIRISRNLAILGSVTQDDQHDYDFSLDDQNLTVNSGLEHDSQATTNILSMVKAQGKVEFFTAITLPALKAYNQVTMDVLTAKMIKCDSEITSNDHLPKPPLPTSYTQQDRGVGGV